jgi:undecaprenyl-diphosphatase
MNWSEKLFLRINSVLGKNRWLDAFGRAGAEWVIFAMIGWYITINLIINYGNTRVIFIAIGSLFAYIALSWLISLGIGLVVGETRPHMRIPESHALFWPMSNWKSFPSDHATMALSVFYCALLFDFPTAWSLLPLALWVGWGRVYSGVHYPHDILGGFGLSSILFLLIILVRYLI